MQHPQTTAMHRAAGKKPIIFCALGHPHLLLALLALTASACSGGEVRQKLGLNRNAPDEFSVVSRPALSVPPDFDLRPPRPGEAPRGISTEDTARAALLGSDAKPAVTPETMEMPKGETAVVPVIATDAPSGGEASFLKHTGAVDAPSDIRTQLGADANRPTDTKNAKSLYEQLVAPDTSEPVVDPTAEAARLRSTKEQGQPANEGDVPVESSKPSSVLDHIF